MYRLKLIGIDNINQYEELIKVFMPHRNYEIISNNDDFSELQNSEGDYDTFVFDGDKNKLKREIYESLRIRTGKSPKWGILTGIRPVKLAGELYKKLGSMEAVINLLENEYLLHPSKSRLTAEILEYQLNTAGKPESGGMSVYIGIPFCPTRCLYCSFTSNQVKKPEIDRYLKALFKEIEYCGRRACESGLKLESLYIGGGTPTTLDEEKLQSLLNKINDCFNIRELREFTVEAGRPDTITSEKLEIMKRSGVDRISINPQTMKQETLDLIGRRHTVQETETAFSMAADTGMECVNADLIAGLPQESFEDFKATLDRIIQLQPDNITLHTLAVKRASRLKEMDEEFNYKDEELREQMLVYASEALGRAGYRPYYLYRQKHTSGNTENIGYCRDDKVSIYNIRIMEEAQSILAMGAGGISKVFFPDENRLERVPNVSNYEIYIDRIDEMTERKEKNFWR